MDEATNEATRERHRQRWQTEQRAKAQAALPLGVQEMRAWLASVEGALQHQACNQSRRHAEAWLLAQSIPAPAPLEWLDNTSGLCDCEVVSNSGRAFRDAMGES